MELWDGVSKLRALVSEELGPGWYVFPVLDDYSLRQRWRKGDFAGVWPQARCLHDDNVQGSKRSMDVLLLDLRAGEPNFVARATRREAEKEKEGALSQLVHELFYEEASAFSGNVVDVPCVQEEEEEEFVLLHRIYHKGTVWKKRHAGFVDCLCVVPPPTSSEQPIGLFFYHGNELHLGSFFSANRQALRRRWSSCSSTRANRSAYLSAETDVAREEDKFLPPFLLGSDPIVDDFGEGDDLPARFLFYQCVRALDFLHRYVLTEHGGLRPEMFTITSDFWVEMIPPVLPAAASGDEGKANSSPFQVVNDTRQWREGKLSNFDYLMNINQASGRRTGGVGTSHAILPWIIDFDNAQNCARDLARTKYRLKKGERQLQATFSPTITSSAGAPHHIPESLSELTYYMYLSRNTPISVLQRVVRPVFDAREYPNSLARLYEWTPDECVPEFFADAQVFLPTALGLKCLVCGGADLEQEHLRDHLEETKSFLRMHVQALETCDGQGLARWIDLHFGSHLQGRLAVDALNVVLSPHSKGWGEDAFSQLRRVPDFVRVFAKPHPLAALTTSGSNPCIAGAVTAAHSREEEQFLSHVLLAMLAPRGGLKLIQSELKNSTFLGSDLVEWLLLRGIAGVDTTSDAIALAQRMMTYGYFMPEPQSVGAGGRREFDFADGEDCAYRFRISSDRKWQGQVVSPPPPAPEQDVFCDRMDILASFNAHKMHVDAEHSGLIRTASYYPRQGRGGDTTALALIIGELYLGKPVEANADLDVLPASVRDALRLALEESEENEEDIMSAWLANARLFPPHFAVAFDLISAVRLLAPDTREQCRCLALRFPQAFHPLLDAREVAVEAAWLTFPLVHHLLTLEPQSFAEIFPAMHGVLGEEPAFRNFVDAVIAGTGAMACEHWIHVLPVVDAYLEHFVHALAMAMQEGEGKDALVSALEQALLGAESSHGRILALLSAARLPPSAPIFKLFASKQLPAAALDASATSSNASALDEFEQQQNVTAVTGGDEDSSEEEGETMASASLLLHRQNSFSNAPPKRNIEQRFLAHADAAVTCMTAAPISMLRGEDSLFATASHRGEVALWKYAAGGSVAQTCRFRASLSEEPPLAYSPSSSSAIQSMRFLPGAKLAVNAVHNNSLALFDLASGGGAQRCTSWIPNVRCAESFHRDSLLLLGEATGDVALCDFRQAAHLASRFALPTTATMSSAPSPVRSIHASRAHPFHLTCSVNERLFELDVRVVGRIVREWSAAANVVKLFALDKEERNMVAVMKGGNVATVWDTALAKLRLRALAGFTDKATPTGPESVTGSRQMENIDEFDSLVAMQSDDGDGDGATAQLQRYMYVVRGTHKLARVPLTLPEEPKEVRVQPLSLIQANSSAKRYKPGQLCLTSVCVLPGQTVFVAGHDQAASLSKSHAFPGSFLHLVV